MESLEIALLKYNKKTWCKSGLLGFFIGLAVIVPGISGSTVAIIFKLYDNFLYAVGNLFKKFKLCFLFWRSRFNKCSIIKNGKIYLGS